MTPEIPPPPLPARPTEPPSGVYRAMDRDAERLQRAMLADAYPPSDSEGQRTIVFLLIYVCVIMLALGLVTGCSFEAPDQLLQKFGEFDVPENVGPRPASFSCTVETESGSLTVSGDDPHVTRFELEGEPPIAVQSADPVTDVLMGGVEIVVVGDVLVVGERVWRLGDCESTAADAAQGDGSNSSSSRRCAPRAERRGAE